MVFNGGIVMVDNDGDFGGESRSGVDLGPLGSSDTFVKNYGRIFGVFAGLILQLGPLLKVIGEVCSKLPHAYQEALMKLAYEGWYVDPEWTLEEVYCLLAQVVRGDSEGAKAWVVDYYSKNIDSVEKRLCSGFPKNGKVLSKAFFAHREGHYELSIPVFLIQAESICKSERQCELFGQKARRDLRRTGLSEVLSAAPLLNVTPVNASSNERDPVSVALNRHRVIHGEDLDYGTFENSVKALSLLAFVSSVLVVEHANDTNG